MADDAHLDRISDYVITMLKAPTWVSPIANFIDQNCLIFDEEEENKLEYTIIHNAFTFLVDELLAGHLAELSVSTDDFIAFCQRGLSGNNELHRSLVEQLVSVDDFLVFKAMMVKRGADLRKETLESERAELEEAKAREEAEQMELMRLEAERLEVERRCLEAELQLMLALSMQLEQRLQLTQALNELMEVVSKMEQMAQEEAAEQNPPQQSLPPLKNAPVLPDTVRVQTLRPPGDAEPAPVPGTLPTPTARNPAPTPAPAPTPTGPSEAERQARAEHLKRQREALVEKKKRERAAELQAYQQTQGPSAASRIAERAAQSGPVTLQQPPVDGEAGKRLAAELSGITAAPGPALPDPEAAAIQMRKTIARQLKQSLTESMGS